MSEIDPRRLTVILEDLQKEWVWWALVARDTLGSATYRQQLSEEEGAQALRAASIVQTKVENGRARVLTTEAHVSNIESLGAEAGELALQTLHDANEWHQQAAATLRKWESQLELALAWLARAEERVRLAEIELAAAQRALHAAQSELHSAQSALQNCLNYRDEKGRRRNCSGYTTRVATAQAAVAVCAERVRMAEIELKAALAERERARARVRCCKQSVAFSQQAVTIATEAQELATMGVNAAERSKEAGQSARHWSVRNLQAVAQEEELSEELLNQVHVAQRLIDEAHVQHTLATRAEEVAQRYRILGGKELEHRIQQLYFLNRPTLTDHG